jgi:hypothetical protein
MNLTRYTGSNEWSALYVDGKLDIVGDHYLIDDRIMVLTGVEEIPSEDFMRGGNSRQDVAPTLDALATYQIENGAKEQEAQAQALRDQAAALIAQADALTKEN